MTDCEAIEVKHSSAGRRSASSPRRAVTLMELLTVTIVIGILSVMTIPTIGTSIEQSHADLAGGNLKFIWTAQRYYWLDNREFAPDLVTLNSARLLDVSVVSGSRRYAYAIDSADADGFQASATRVGSEQWGGAFEIDESGTITGTVQSPSRGPITPGFE
ncbi:MAG: prepilin-type cleavage/methylation domain-containing protein [Planctomycetes bacterium]|nr:prepilin-type cleavage/methylation domain-containing protein [Planctomycetota bacterium]